MGKRKKDKAITETQEIIQKLVHDEVNRAKEVYENKKRQEVEVLHNKIADVIQEVGAHPTSVIFVLEILKEEVLRQFLHTVEGGGNG